MASRGAACLVFCFFFCGSLLSSDSRINATSFSGPTSCNQESTQTKEQFSCPCLDVFSHRNGWGRAAVTVISCEVNIERQSRRGLSPGMWRTCSVCLASSAMTAGSSPLGHDGALAAEAPPPLDCTPAGGGGGVGEEIEG